MLATYKCYEPRSTQNFVDFEEQAGCDPWIDLGTNWGTMKRTSVASKATNNGTRILLAGPANYLVTVTLGRVVKVRSCIKGEATVGHGTRGLLWPVVAICFSTCIALTVIVNGSDSAAELKERIGGAYKGVFYENDFSYLKDPKYQGHLFGEGLKSLHAGPTKLDIGGEQRVRYHSEDNLRGLGVTGRDDQFWLTRTRLYGDLRLNEDLRVYGEFIHADSGGQTLPARTIEINRVDMLNLFADTKLLDGLTARIGRQELLYGSQRLVSPLDWANTRRKFQGAKLLNQIGSWKVDGFWVQPMEQTDPQRAFFDDLDSPDDQVNFYGIYATNPKAEVGTVDLYHLVLEDGHAGFTYHTTGTRMAGDYSGWLYETEIAYQFGTEGNGDAHAAGMIVTGLGHAIEPLGVKSTVWGWYEYASGDSDPVAGGFHHLFPLAHKYNGFMDLFGRRNLHDINVQWIIPGSSKTNVLVWYHYLMLDRATTPYSVVMTPYNLGNRAFSRDLGHEIDMLLTYARSPREQIQLGYSFFAAGDYYALTPGVQSRNDAQFFYTQYQWQF